MTTTRRITRYGSSRKLYDTVDRRYVGLDDIASLIRQGEMVKAVDSKSGADVTAQILTQVILEEGKKGTWLVPSELLHAIVRSGERAIGGAHSVGRMVSASVERVSESVDKVRPFREARKEIRRLRDRFEQLERSLGDLTREPTRGRKVSARPRSSRGRAGRAG